MILPPFVFPAVGNLRVVWAEFSTLSLAVFVMRELKTQPRVRPVWSKQDWVVLNTGAQTLMGENPMFFKQAALMRRPTVLNLPPQLVFPP